MVKKLQAKLDELITNTCFIYINKEILPKEIEQVVANAFIKVLGGYLNLDGFNVKQERLGNAILVTLLNSKNYEVVGTALLSYIEEENMIKITNSIATLKINV